MLNIVHMTVNGKEVELAVDPRESLLETLRERLGLRQGDLAKRAGMSAAQLCSTWSPSRTKSG